MAKLFPCMTCGTLYEDLEGAEVCEALHKDKPLPSWPPAPRGWCAFCEQTTDPCGCKDGRPQPQILAPEAVMRLGALTIQTEQSQAVEHHLDDQRIAYEEALRLHGPQGLITALLERDRLLLNQGRTLADQRAASRLLREFMRGALYTAGGKPQIEAAEAAIKRLGGESADARQLKLHGSTLGPLEAPEQVAEALADGTRKQR